MKIDPLVHKNRSTLTLLWKEYFENCRLENSRPLMYSAFCNQYQQFASKHKATLHVEHKPGERMEVDWAGDTAFILDNISGKPIPVYVFVAVLPCSGYAYTEGSSLQLHRIIFLFKIGFHFSAGEDEFLF